MGRRRIKLHDTAGTIVYSVKKRVTERLREV